jgi:hypothetical protein
MPLNQGRFDLVLGGWVWTRSLLGTLGYHQGKSFGTCGGFTTSILIYFDGWTNFMKEGALGV